MPWNIYLDRSGQWRWELVDSKAALVSRSARSFLTRLQCVLDARTHGYLGEHQGPADCGSDEQQSD